MIHRILALVIVVCFAACGGQQKGEPKKEGKSFKETQQALDLRIEEIRDDALKDLGTIEKQLNKAAKSVQTSVSKSKKEGDDAHYITVESLKTELDALALEVQKLSAETEEELESKAKKIDEKVKGLDSKTKELEAATPDDANEPESEPIE